MQRIYVGLSKDHGPRITFRSAVEPTEQNFGHLYAAVIGPFRTIRGARFMAKYGSNNPHILSVADAERLSK